EASEDESPAAPSAPAVKKPVKSKWEGEDEEDDAPSDWEASSDEEKPKAASAPVAPPKKKGTLKAKLAEIEAEKAARAAAGDDDYDEDAVLDPREKARLDRERELNADLSNAADLLGAAALGGTSSSELDYLISAQPRTKEDFIKFSDKVIEYIIKRHQNKPLYATFLEHHVRELAMPLRDVEVRKTASVLTTLANEKQKEQREKASSKKKPKAAAKPILGSAKVSNKVDTSVYDEALDDLDSNPDDFM
ncbi:translation initiation factor eIF3 subunit, partial [Wolfiporia cocos MD-104 SS10]